MSQRWRMRRMCFPKLLGNPEFRPPYPCATSLWNSSAGRSSRLCPVLERCNRETLPEQGMQHGEVPALLPWEAAAAPAENRPSTLAKKTQYKTLPGSGTGLSFSVAQNGFRFRASLCRKRYTADAKVSRCWWFRKEQHCGVNMVRDEGSRRGIFRPRLGQRLRE